MMVIWLTSFDQSTTHNQLDGRSRKRYLQSLGVEGFNIKSGSRYAVQERASQSKQKKQKTRHPPPDSTKEVIKHETVNEVLRPLLISFDMSHFPSPRRLLTGTRKPTDCAAIFVHAGAGYHSITNESVHLQACEEYVNHVVSYTNLS
jgi:hypothetical protein